MKRIFIFFCMAFIINSLFAQTTIEYAKHGILLGDHTVMTKVEYVEPSYPGMSKIWDYTNLRVTGEEVDDVLAVEQTPFFEGMKKANLAIKVNDDFYSYFRTTPEKHEQIGYAGKGYKIVYSQPIVRMLYPFSYGSFYSGTYSGQGFYTGATTTDIAGDYSIEADAVGTLLLPGNIVLKNVLRVAATNNKYEFSRCYHNEAMQTKYLFYTQNQGSPVFAIIETRWVKDKDTSYYKTAAVNKYILPDGKTTAQISKEEPKYNYVITPNPFNTNFTVKFEMNVETDVTIELMSAEGTKIANICKNKRYIPGIHSLEYFGSTLPSATYYVRLTFGNKTYISNIIKIQ